MVGRHDETSDSQGPLRWGKREKPTPHRPRFWTWPMITAGALMLSIVTALIITLSLWLN